MTCARFPGVDILRRFAMWHRPMVRLGQVWWGYKVNHSSMNSTTITRNFKTVHIILLKIFTFFEDCIYLFEAIFLDLISDLFSKIWRQFILKTIYPRTVYPQDSLSSGQFILRTVYPQDSLSSRQFILRQFILKKGYPQAKLSLRINCLRINWFEDKLVWG